MILLYAEIISNRLQYIADFIGKKLSGEEIRVTSDREAFSQFQGIKINYSNEKISMPEFWLQPQALLFEKNIRVQPLRTGEWKGQKIFFQTGGDFPFDIFAAAFYLLSRYEEYLPHEKDEFGRYAPVNALAFRENFLQLPLVDIWINFFKAALAEKFPAYTFYPSRFTFLPTYDIDEAFAYRHKGLLRTAGGLAKQLLQGKFHAARNRILVLNNKVKDPYDSFDWMNDLHEAHILHPVFFFHVAKRNGKYDKNILPSCPAMQKLIRQYAEKCTVGIHPSWQSGDDDRLLKAEIETLENITGKKIKFSRQHYIRFNLPSAFRKLIEAGITDDYSMGYGSINGFRASVASSFYWYDLEKEEKTHLALHPFCFMDANSFFEQKYLPQQALEEMRHYYNVIRSVNGQMITIWHNTFFGWEKMFVGWKDVYEQFIKEMT